MQLQIKFNLKIHQVEWTTANGVRQMPFDFYALPPRNWWREMAKTAAATTANINISNEIIARLGSLYAYIYICRFLTFIIHYSPFRENG